MRWLIAICHLHTQRHSSGRGLLHVRMRSKTSKILPQSSLRIREVRGQIHVALSPNFASTRETLG